MSEIKTGDSHIPAKFRVIEAGDVGSRAIHRVKDEQITGVEWVMADGIDPKEDPCAANPAALVRGANIVIVVCGMGDATGIGAASAIAKAAREQGVLTVGMVSKPFGFTDTQRRENAPLVIRLKKHVDTLIVIPNDRTDEALDENTAFSGALYKLERALLQVVRRTAEFVNLHAAICLDVADVSKCMKSIKRKNQHREWTLHLYGHVHDGTEHYFFQKCIHEMNREDFAGKIQNGKPLLAYNAGCMMPYMDYEPHTYLLIS